MLGQMIPDESTERSTLKHQISVRNASMFLYARTRKFNDTISAFALIKE